MLCCLSSIKNFRLDARDSHKRFRDEVNDHPKESEEDQDGFSTADILQEYLNQPDNPWPDGPHPSNTDEIISNTCTGSTYLKVFESDLCIQLGQRCVLEGQQAWREFLPALEKVVLRRLRSLHYKYQYHFGQANEDERTSLLLDEQRSAAMEITKKLFLCPPEKFVKLSRARKLDLALVYRNYSIYTDFPPDLIRVMAKTFRRPWVNARDTIVAHIEEHFPEHDFVSTLEDCNERIGNLSLTDFAKMATILDAAATITQNDNTDHELRLGNLLVYAFTNYNDVYVSDYERLFESVDFLNSVSLAMDMFKAALFPNVKNPIWPVRIANWVGFESNINCFREEVLRKLDLDFPDNSYTCENKEFGYKKEELPGLREVLKLMKYTVLPTSYHATRNERREQETLRELFSERNYTFADMGMLNEDFAISTCKFGNKKLSLLGHCNLFSSVFTTDGVGYAFNNLPYWQMYKKTQSNHIFFKEFYEREVSMDHRMPRKIEAAGDSFSLDFYVRQSAYSHNTAFEHKENILLALHDPATVPNLKAIGIKVEPGKYYEISVTPSVTVTDQSGYRYGPKKRNCLSHTENEKLAFFKTYSQSACIFECQLRKAVEGCNCTAWDYPSIAQNIDICGGQLSVNCFYYVMSKPMKPGYCNCLSDCDSIQYDISVTSGDLQWFQQDLGLTRFDLGFIHENAAVRNTYPLTYLLGICLGMNGDNIMTKFI